MDSSLIINRIKKAIHSNDPKTEAFLFGSGARGDNRLDSVVNRLYYSCFYAVIAL